MMKWSGNEMMETRKGSALLTDGRDGVERERGSGRCLNSRRSLHPRRPRPWQPDLHFRIQPRVLTLYHLSLPWQIPQ